jgi:hypothetical protein
MLARANLSKFAASPLAGLEQAGTEAPPPAEAEAVMLEIPAEPYHAQITITSLQLTPIKPSASAPGKKLRANLSFQLSGVDAPRLASHAVPYRISIYTIEYGKGTPAQVASSDGRLAPKQFEYAHRLEFAEPK